MEPQLVSYVTLRYVTDEYDMVRVGTQLVFTVKLMTCRSIRTSNQMVYCLHIAYGYISWSEFPSWYSLVKNGWYSLRPSFLINTSMKLVVNCSVTTFSIGITANKPIGVSCLVFFGDIGPYSYRVPSSCHWIVPQNIPSRSLSHTTRCSTRYTISSWYSVFT
jgi:hypothetical protein